MTLFGSTNLNSRSAHLDTELSFAMVVPEEETDLRQRLADEVAGIRADVREWRGHERRVPFSTQLIVSIVGGML
jgi:CDP-diacylglycerol---glycerol-3-phosphate 3-phosphatidyltransferase